jgi:hypothetical protein
MKSNAMFTMTRFLKLCYNVFILENKIDALTSVQKNLCQNVLCHVGNCVSLCQYGEIFLLVKGLGSLEAQIALDLSQLIFVLEVIANSYRNILTLFFKMPHK